ncbi:hypothetical protein SAMD00019534_100610 [Acytostelium subglobosum LB1]|uniref:hypothetical protein n=1 Tax=Acytostelium subglobosum LB1 TaxID=1410327 RepID=UPI00064518F3|nr:hypothetical protein SAMD00019534_100610 [Acytostelium subglobosum LB1]GAM26886.1 hypothetical protein SAMD00019534_100610 [Acytostelium subglobosum LB1]|eukprot:XP_012750154.1 hypothetical protein SAMD00019534_100610 [Acytostelium subglobosum LB1]
MVKKTTKKTTTTAAPAMLQEPEMTDDAQMTATDENDTIVQLKDRFEKIVRTGGNDSSSNNNNASSKDTAILSNILATLNNANNINNNNNVNGKDMDYKKRYIEMKDKLALFKKMKNTDTENLFEDFKIAAEKRDSDSKKYISQLKFQVEVLQQKNSLLNETLKNKFGCDYDELQKQITDRRELEEKFKIDQVKAVLNEKIKEDDKIISQLTLDKEQLQRQMAEMKEDFERRMASANQQFESLVNKHNNERYESQRSVDTMSQEVNEKLAESRFIIAQLQTENQALQLRIQVIEQELQEHSELYNEGKQKLVDEWILSDKQKSDEAEQRLKELKQIYETQIAKIKQHNDENIKKFHDDFVQAETRFKKLNQDLVEQKNNELVAVEKQLNDEIEQLEDRRLKEHQASLQTQKIHLSEIQDLKSKLESGGALNKTNQVYLDLYHMLTSIKLSQVTDEKFELIVQNKSQSNKKIQGEIVIGDQEISYNPISIDNCNKVSECVENQIDFPKHQVSAFMMKLIETVYA